MLTISLLLACGLCNGQNFIADTSKAKIKFTTNSGYEASEKQGETPKDKLTTKATFQYNEKGNVIQSNFYDIKTNAVFSVDKRVYDANGNVIEITFYNREGELEGKDIHKYDDKNKEIEKDNYWKGKFNGKVTTTYDYEKMIVKVNYFKADGSQERNSFSYKIDDKGNHIEEYNPKGQILTKSTFTYNDKGKVTTENCESWEDDYYKATVTYQYDKMGNEIKRKITNTGKKMPIISYVNTDYVYDKFGNWINKIITWSGSAKRQTEKREIQYY